MAKKQKEPEIWTYYGIVNGKRIAVSRSAYYGPGDIRPLGTTYDISPEELASMKKAMGARIGKALSDPT